MTFGFDTMLTVGRSALGALRAVLRWFKERADQKRILAKRNQELSDQNTDMGRRNQELSEEVRRLKASLAAKQAFESMEFDGQVYWKGDAGDLTNGPYCPNCKAKGQAVRLRDRGNGTTMCVDLACRYWVRNEHFGQYPNFESSTRKPVQRRARPLRPWIDRW